MLLSSVILVLQELLEASLILSVLMVYSLQLGISRRWVWPALMLGIAGAAIYASRIETVSEWFDYVGLEVVNGAIQFAICLFIIIFVALRLKRESVKHPLVWQILMIIVVSLAFTREGFEILLYEDGFIHNKDYCSSVWLGSLLGAGIGLSVGALLYYGLSLLGQPWGMRILLILLAMFTGNMAAQGTTLLIQADWLSSGHALWNTEHLLSESSLVGKLLYALVGYEASPAGLQVGAYLFLFLLVIGLAALRWPGKHVTTDSASIS